MKGITTMKEGNASSTNRGALLLLSMNLFIIMVGIGLVIPILPYYVEKFGANAQVLGALVAVYSFMQFIFAPIWGKWSDRIGRKPLITIGLFGFAIAEFLFAFALDVWMLFISRIVAGLFGSALMPTAMAYVSDVTSEEKRGQGMGVLGAAMGLGFVIGPGVGGFLAEWDLSVPFIVAGIAGGIAGVVSFFVLPESYPKEKRSGGDCHHSMRQGQLTLIRQALKSSVGLLFILVFFMSFGLANFQSIFGYYTYTRYGFGPKDVGLVILVIGLIGTVIQGVGVGKLTQRFGEEKVVKGSFLLSAFGFLLMIMAIDFFTVLVTTSIFYVGNAFLRPSLNAYISKKAGQQQGFVMGLNNSFMSLGNVIGPLLAGTLFEWNIHIPYVFGALIMLVGFGSLLLWRKKEANTISTHS
jgi:MFS transporter, DHA1 family, multidrug resistance protein